MAGLIKSVGVSAVPIAEDYIEKALADGQKLWNAVKEASKDPNFAGLPDSKKIDAFASFHQFNTEFPIVSRYLICMGQYSGKAFKRQLLKVKNTKHPEVPEKGYMEDQWVCRQADYVRYLWESYQRGHFNNAEAKAIWDEAYKNLKKEFTDFREMHGKVEKKLEREKAANKSALVSELMERLASGKQSLDDGQMKELIEVLSIQLAYQRKEKLVSQIKANGKLR